MICRGLRGDSGGCVSIRQPFIHIDRGGVSRLAATVVKFARLPEVQTFGRELRREAGRIGRGIKGFSCENSGRLMMTMLAGCGGGIHRDHYFRP